MESVGDKKRSAIGVASVALGTARSDSCDQRGIEVDLGDRPFDMTRTANVAAVRGTALAAFSGQALSCECDVPEADPNGDCIKHKKVSVAYTRRGSTKADVLQNLLTACVDGAEGWRHAQGHEKFVVVGSIAASKAMQRPESISFSDGTRW
jgi:hypothetical protein